MFCVDFCSRTVVASAGDGHGHPCKAIATQALYGASRLCLPRHAVKCTVRPCETGEFKMMRSNPLRFKMRNVSTFQNEMINFDEIPLNIDIP